MAANRQMPTGSGFGARSEPSEVLAGIDLSGKVAVVTGGYSGIGLETVRALLDAGVRVHLPVRSVEKAAQVLGGLQGDLVVGEADLAHLDTVRDYAARVLASDSRVDILINNAGVMACPELRIGNGWESQFAINHLGHFELTRALLPALLEADQARVVCLSSVAHRRSDLRWEDIHFRSQPYDKWEAYGQAKTANALFALGLDLKYHESGLRAFSVHPGGILTPLQRHLGKEEMQALGWLDEHGNLSERAAKSFKTPSQGCATTLWAASSPLLESQGGQYCEDCDVASLADEQTPRFQGVQSWATDDDSAMRLWEVSERMLETVR